MLAITSNQGEVLAGGAVEGALSARVPEVAQQGGLQRRAPEPVLGGHRRAVPKKQLRGTLR